MRTMRLISAVLAGAVTAVSAGLVPVYAAESEHLLLAADFNSGDTSTSAGAVTACGGVTYEEISDGDYAVQLDGSTGYLSLTNADGTPLLEGMDSAVISMRAKVEKKTGSAWYFYAAPNDNAQINTNRCYTGLLDNYTSMTYERYNSEKWRSATLTSPTSYEWQDISVVIAPNQTDLYVNGEYVGTEEYSGKLLSDILGTSDSQVFYVGKANWTSSGEWMQGYVDDISVYDFAPVIQSPSVLTNLTNDSDLGLETVTESDNKGYTITWSSSDTDVITDAGRVIQAETVKDVTLTATIAYDDITLSRAFDAQVLGTEEFAITANNVTVSKTSASAGEEITVTPSIPDGKVMTDVTVNGESIYSSIDSNGSFSFTMPSEAVTVQAVLEDKGIVAEFTMDTLTEDGITYTGGELTVGQKNNAVNFEDNAYAQLSQYPLRDSFTFSAWLKSDTLGTWERLFDFGTDTGSYIFLTANNGSAPCFEIVHNSSAKQTIVAQQALKTGVWNHIAVTCDDGAIKLYSDGEEIGSGTITIKPMMLRGDSMTNYIAKSHFSADPYFAGSVDEIKIYNYALTADEIKSEMNATAAEVESIETVSAEIEVGETPVLPSEVEVTYTNGMTAKTAVEWSELSAMTQKGTYTIEGKTTIAGVEYTVTAKITVTSASNDDNYSISRTVNYVKNSGAAYVDAILNISTEKTDELTMEISFEKDGASVGETTTKKITDAQDLEGESILMRVPVTQEGTITVTAKLYKTSTPESVISEITRTIDNKPSFSDTENVKLEEDSLFDKSEQTGLDYILGVDVARLLQPSYEMHGLELVYEDGVDVGQSSDTSAGDTVVRYGGWETKGTNTWGGSAKPDSFTLAGESMGHWLSAAAVFWRNTQNETVLSRMNYLVDKLDALQKADITADTATSKAYIGGCPETTFTKCFEGDTSWGSGYWVPWYGVHKIYQGLLDVYDYAPEETAAKAYDVLKRFADWAVDGSANLTDAQMQSVLDTEYGGMNEIFARMYEITGKDKYLSAGRRFTHDSVVDPLITNDTASLSGKHANTQIPKFVGAAELYEQDSETYADYKTACENFWTNVNTERCYAIGGNSLSEHFQTAGTEELGVKTCESCNTYNMMRLTEHIFSWHYSDNDSQYMDWYEKALYNHILGQQEPQTGAKMYFVSLLQGHHRIYEDKYNSWWCCTGTGMENPGRYTRVQYFEDNTNSTLYVNLYLAGTYTWEEKGLTFKVETNYPYSDTVKYTVTGTDGVQADIRLRAPSWIASDMTATVGDSTYTAEAGTYLSVNREWNEGDVMEVTIPMSLHLYTPRTDGQIVYEYGPVVLAADLGECDESLEYTAVETKLDLTTADVPYIVPSAASDPTQEELLGYVDTVDASSLKFEIKAENSSTGEAIALQPFTEITHSFHNVYWNIGSAGDEYEIGLNKITIDTVEPDGQQDELGHGLAQNAEDKDGYYYESHQGTVTVNGKSYYWRDAYGSADSFFQYNMKVDGTKQNYLLVRYYGSDGTTGDGKRDFNIYVDGTKIANQTLNSNNPGNLYDVFYTIPEELTSGKSVVIVRFAPSSADCIAGGVLNVRTTTSNDPTAKTLPDTVEFSTDGDTVTYTSEYDADSSGCDMTAAMYGGDGALLQIKINEASGSFTVPEDGKIKVFFWNDMVPLYDTMEYEG